MTDPVELVEEALEPTKFNVLDAARNIAYPEDDVTIYLDVTAEYRVRQIEEQIAALKNSDADKIDELDAERKELVAKIKATAHTFHLRGIAPGQIEALGALARTKFPEVDEGDFNEARAKWFEHSVYAQHIVTVTNAEGEVDDHAWSVDEVEELRDRIAVREFDKIKIAVSQLSFAAAAFDQAVSADFS